MFLIKDLFEMPNDKKSFKCNNLAVLDFVLKKLEGMKSKKIITIFFFFKPEMRINV